jgi:uncharacterized membrane protein YeiB
MSKTDTALHIIKVEMAFTAFCAIMIWPMLIGMCLPWYHWYNEGPVMWLQTSWLVLLIIGFFKTDKRHIY